MEEKLKDAKKSLKGKGFWGAIRGRREGWRGQVERQREQREKVHKENGKK